MDDIEKAMNDREKIIDGFAYWIGNEENGVCYIPLDLCKKVMELLLKEQMPFEARINLNDRVKVKLTALGIKTYIDYMNGPNEGRDHNPVIKPKDCVPNFNKDGYTHFQLWELFNLYGEHMTIASKPMFFPLEIIKAE